MGGLSEPMCRRVANAVLVAWVLVSASAAAEETAGGDTMGTTWTARWHGTAQGTDPLPSVVVSDELHRILERVNRLMSTWRDDSEVSRFNASSSTDWFEVSPETARVVSRALEISAASDGAFDVTVSPLVQLWGFGSGGPRAAPGAAQLEAARRLVGSNKLTVRDRPPAIRKSDPGVTIDLSAIAKGYAVDLLGEFLESVFVSGYLVEVGGETRVKGSRPDGAAWRIGIEQPVAGLRRVRSVLSLGGPRRGVATSGDYRNRRTVAGRVVSHTLDPRSGRPIEHALAAVTVVAADCMTADAWATALMVLGPEQGLAVAKQHRVAALLLSREGTAIREQSTDEYRAIESESAGGGWWGTWLPVLVLVSLAVAGLSAGVLLRGRALVGSCGGLALMCRSRDDPLCAACGVPGVADEDAGIAEAVEVVSDGAKS